MAAPYRPIGAVTALTDQKSELDRLGIHPLTLPDRARPNRTADSPVPPRPGTPGIWRPIEHRLASYYAAATRCRRLEAARLRPGSRLEDVTKEGI